MFVLTVDRTKSSHCYTAGLIDLEVDFSPEPTFPSLIHCKIDCQIPIQKTIRLAELRSDVSSQEITDPLRAGLQPFCWEPCSTYVHLFPL